MFFPVKRILVRGLFALCLLASGGSPSVSAQSLPACTMSLIGTYIEPMNDGVDQMEDIDKDGDGLIEICDLEGLNEIRFQLDGSGYTTGTSAMGAMKITTGCPNDRCTGYELTSGLDFMDDNSYRTTANKVT